MKKSIIYLGIALVTFSNVALALDFQQSFNEENQAPQTNERLAPGINKNVTSGQKSSAEGGRDLESVSPEIIGFKPYEKTAEEVIAENNQITESVLSNEVTEEISLQDIQTIDVISIEIAPVCSEKSMEDRILQDSLIIESAIEVQPCTTGKSKKA
nr:hypothetical protein [uncultured Flavobacterium sp.]